MDDTLHLTLNAAMAFVEETALGHVGSTRVPNGFGELKQVTYANTKTRDGQNVLTFVILSLKKTLAAQGG